MATSEQRLPNATASTPRRGKIGQEVLAPTIGAAVLALLVLLWFGLNQRDKGSVGTVASPFKKAPDFSLGLFDGSTLRFSDALASGKPAVVNFWGSWCGPCADEATTLASASQKYGDRVTFVGVDVEDIDSDAQAFIRRYGMAFPNGSGNAGEISIAWGMRGVPETYFVAPDGSVVRKWNGPLDANGLDQFLGELERTSGHLGS